MKKIRLALAALVLTTVAGSIGVSNATPQYDPFGGSEEDNQASCGTGTTPVPMVGEVKADPNKGVFVCNDGSNGSVLSMQPGNKVEGRIFVYKDGNKVSVVVDGEDADNSGGAKGWDRLDVNPDASSCKVKFRRGTAGQAWNSDGSSDNPDAPPSNGSPNCAA